MTPQIAKPETDFSRFSMLDNFGHSLRSPARVYRVKDAEQAANIFQWASREGLSIGLRGAGRSYNDAALNGGGILLDFQDMNHILDWNPDTGIVRVEPGVNLEQLWQHILADGWWIPVVSGTMSTTLGGCLAMNIHGKNNYQAGTIGEHVLQFTALTPTGAEISCSPNKNRDLFYGMIGGLGLLGVFTSITLQMKRIYSGLLEVHAWNTPNLQESLECLDEQKDKFDYLVGWLDCTTRGRNMGRGQLHCACYLPEDADPEARKTLQVAFQTLPPRFFGIIPKSYLHVLMAPFLNNPGVRAVNLAKYLSGKNRVFRQAHAAFHFLLDYVPDWERAYGRGGLIQYQTFIPKETVLSAWQEMLTISNQRGMPSFLGVTKRHRPDPFLLTHGVDGFSLAMDYKVHDHNRAPLAEMLQEFDRITLQAGGRLYFAKNSETLPGTVRRFLGEDTLTRFSGLKRRCDPDNVLQSDLYRRVFR